jgi:hypothetical protein
MRAIRFFILAATLSACIGTAKTREYLDNDTAVSVIVAASGWVFAREHPDLAVYAQDYITVTPVQLNRNGQRTLYLYCQLWSTIDRRNDKTFLPAKAQLALIADDRRIPLPDIATDTHRLGFGRPPVDAPSRATEIRALAIDIDLFRFIADADQLRVALDIDDTTEYFLLWRDGRANARDFLQHAENAPR